MTGRVITFPTSASALEHLLKASLERVHGRDGTPARISYDVPIASLARALNGAGLTFDCVDGIIVIRRLTREEMR